MILFDQLAVLEKVKTLETGVPLVTFLPNGCCLTAQCLAGTASGTSAACSVASGYLHILEGTGIAYGNAKAIPLIAGQGLLIANDEEVQLVNVGEGPLKFISLAQ